MTMACAKIGRAEARCLLKMAVGKNRDQLTIKTPNPKWRLYWCKDTVGHVGIFDPSFRPSNLLTGSPPSPPPLPCVISTVQGYEYVLMQCVTGGGIGLCGEHLQDLYTVYLTRFRTYKVALPPQTKT